MSGENLYGLVLAGGKSSRMGRDKSLIVYHDKTQRDSVFEMLTTLCSSVYISSNKDQMSDKDSLVDEPEFENIGPLAGLLTAMKTFSGKDFFISSAGTCYKRIMAMAHSAKLDNSQECLIQTGAGLVYFLTLIMMGIRIFLSAMDM